MVINYIKRGTHQLERGFYREFSCRGGFTGKEQDAETGLYYYGARYQDPKTSRWLSTDPALSSYLPTAGGNNSQLPGMGGIYNTVNMHLYHYAGNNPVKFTDPTGLYTEEEINAFNDSSAEEQMAFLKDEYNSAKDFKTYEERGAKAAEMRDLVPGMKLDKLFEADEPFMNGGMRDFLNLKEDGTMNYTMDELTSGNGWGEYSSFFSQYHQTNAPKDGPYNAKFVNKDGREVVIGSDRNVIQGYPDKGTFNYRSGYNDPVGHSQFDVTPFNNMKLNTTNRFHIWGANKPNSSHWN